MGKIITAYCTRNCGLKKNKLYYGESMATYGKECNVPAYNKDKGELEVHNYHDKQNLPENTTFYDSPEMHDGKASASPDLEWGEVQLNQNGNICPNCGHHSMEFLTTGLFD